MREPHSPPPAQYTFWKRGWKIGPVVAASEIGGPFGIAANVLIATTAAIARAIAKMNVNIGRGAICSLPDAPIPRGCFYSNIGATAVMPITFRRYRERLSQCD